MRNLRHTLIVVLLFLGTVVMYKQHEHTIVLSSLVNKQHEHTISLVNTLQYRINYNMNVLMGLTKQFDLSVLDSVGVITNGFGHGSCVAIGPDLVLTAGHCIGQSEVWVEIAGKRYAVLEEWRSERYDVGFVRVDGQLPYLTLGQRPQLLDVVYFVGSPYDTVFVNTITKGIISHLDRDVYNRINLIQTDAEGAPGSSGCPLFNIDGQIIGICVAGPNSGGGVTLCVPVYHIRSALRTYISK